MIPPAAIEVQIQRTSADCAISALSMLTGVPYRTVSEKAIALFAKPHKSGLWTTEIIRLAKSVGVPLARAPIPDIESDETGLLVLFRRNGEGHCATLFQGVVVNPGDGLIYDFGTYLNSKKYTVRAFLK